ncbi:HAD family hydrolase [Halobacteriovorax sp. CON-3]|uniref:HAD family hydrolase n=1 Tax=Halobacteriovorax sp. CON-3 TaxID=3157710 RepID=UPI00371B3D96
MKKENIVLLILITLISFAGAGYYASNLNEDTSLQRWVFFDLGDTIINTKKSGNYHYYEGSLEYIHALKGMGIHVAIISNIPESFGETYEQKIATLKEYVRAHWNDSVEFDWSVFEKIYIPMSNDELKPAPYIFNKALDETGRYPSLYISESLKEVEAARQLGLAGFHFKEGTLNKAKLIKKNIYIHLDEIIDYIDNNSHL